MIEEAYIIVHEADKPDVVGDLSYAHGLAGKDGAEVDLLPLDADAPALGDLDGALVEWVLRGLQRGMLSAPP